MAPRDPQTADLFEIPVAADPIPSGMDYRAQVSTLVSCMLKEAHGDRHEIAAQMSRLTGREISKAMLDGYTSESREAFNLPLWLMPVLEEVCVSTRLSHWMAQVRGAKILFGKDALTAELGKMEKIKENANKQIRLLKKAIGEEE